MRFSLKKYLQKYNLKIKSTNRRLTVYHKIKYYAALNKNIKKVSTNSNVVISRTGSFHEKKINFNKVSIMHCFFGYQRRVEIFNK